MIRYLYIIIIFAVWTLTGVVGKVLFLAFNADVVGMNGMGDALSVVMHGLRHDAAIAGYVSIVPILLVALSAVWRNRLIDRVGQAYTVVVAVIVALCTVINIGLYRHWGFPLDSTPLFYFLSSPKDAMASISIGMMAAGVVGTALLAFAVVMLFKVLGGRFKVLGDRSWVTAIGCLLLGAGCLVPIRGGFSVAVNNVGSVFFSDNIRLNHAAVNPLFSLLESMTHDEDFGSMYRFMPDDEAERLFRTMTGTGKPQTKGEELLTPEFRNAMKGEGVNVMIIVLESFHTYVMDGGEGHLTGVMPEMKRLSEEGLYFTDFHANSFRTDRGLVSILSGYPAQPVHSLMKFPHKTNGLYSIASSLARNGFSTQYIYGGDANFTNMRSYLMGTGFSDIVAIESYDKRDITGKWGVNDSVLFSKALSEIDARSGGNQFRVVQTSSSHEPFDVPCRKFDNKPLNAFYYADRQLGNFISRLKQRDDWQRTLIVIVPDHAGCYPEPEPDGFAPYFSHIPLIMTGGAITGHRDIGTTASQQDIAATLLAMLGIDHSEFTFSKDIFDASVPHFAFFTFPDAVGMKTADGHSMYDNNTGKAIYEIGTRPAANRRKAQAYLQKLYDDIARR